jgi:prepilin-type N-terminal cleavage/methylation domain-containing protein
MTFAASAKSATSSKACFGSSAAARAGGFTLVEMLVVIGIIVVLAGLLLPALFSSYKQAGRVRTASDLNAISSALEAYKQQFGDYPRIIYTSSAPYYGIGSGASVLGKALLGLGDANTATFSATASYTRGQIVVNSGGTQEYGATADVPAGNTPPNASYWSPVAMDTARDGADGPGFRTRTGGYGQIYGPFLQPDKFRTKGLAIVDYWGNPILYYAANPVHPPINVEGKNSPYSNSYGSGDSYVGTAPGVTAGSVSAPSANCASLYNYSDNDTAALTAVGKDTFLTAFGDIKVMYAMLGDYALNGYIGTGETAATQNAFLLWSAGPDGIYGPGALSPFPSPVPSSTTIRLDCQSCDDIANFSFNP